MPTITVENLKKYYGKVKAVDDVSFEVSEGEIFGFLGPNGAGKTTVIRCLMDFLRPDAGEITILGMDAQRNAPELKRDIGFLSGEVSLYNNWTGQEHIDLVEKMRGQTDYDLNLISEFNFEPNKKVSNMSSGNKQKLGLILALMHKPKILILDEPTTGLDPLLQNAFYEIIRTEAGEGKTVFMSSHNLAEVERVCDRVCIIKGGKIVAIESIKELKRKKIYTVCAYFDGPVPKDEFHTDGVTVTKKFEDGMVMNVKGEIDPVLDKLSKYKITDIEIIHASLEEIFLEYYK
ncbi:ABC transporter ATP-binding protein [Patescibacteria group bacterium]|nr:ABC transporter ATP-binding protein [Patescibacteria group bacterium]